MRQLVEVVHQQHGVEAGPIGGRACAATTLEEPGRIDAGIREVRDLITEPGHGPILAPRVQAWGGRRDLATAPLALAHRNQSQLAPPIEVPTVLNFVLALVPMRDTAAMHTTAISATISVYSTIVAPLSPEKRRVSMLEVSAHRTGR